ncbi:MAG: hypothetical protein GY756_11390 [bacterium]|nr:hypothetical protein [bacterium]
MVSNIKLLNIIALVILLYSCKGEIVNGGPDFYSKSDIQKMSSKVLKKGNKDAYLNLSTYYFQKNKLNKLIPFAKVMSDKYNFTQAFYDVYSSLQGFNNDLEHLNKDKQREALSYLIMAYERGHEQANDVLEDYISKELYVEKSANIYIIKKVDNSD